MDIMPEAIFGPFAPIMKVDSFEQALDYASLAQFGLSAYVFTNAVKRLMTTVNDLDFGEIYVNRGGGESVQGFYTGYRNSSIGGEDGKYGLKAYVNNKTMCVHFRTAWLRPRKRRLEGRRFFGWHPPYRGWH